MGKQWEAAWRPELLNTLVLCHGLADLFYVASCDQRKDSNHQLTVLSHALKAIADIVAEKSLPMPGHVCIQQDNTTREGRNQWTMLWGAHLVASGLMSSVTFAFYQVAEFSSILGCSVISLHLVRFPNHAVAEPLSVTKPFVAVAGFPS